MAHAMGYALELLRSCFVAYSVRTIESVADPPQLIPGLGTDQIRLDGK